MERHDNSRGRIWIGVALIVVGMLIFLNNFQFTIFSLDLFSWPIILLLIGIIILLNERDSFFGLILVVVGGVGVASDILNISFKHVFIDYWPVLLILLGIYTVLLAFTKSTDNKIETIELNDNQLDIFSIFSDRTKFIRSNNFKGGKITSILGELNVDLNQCKISDEKIEIDVLTLMGATKLLMPKDWEVINKTTTIFGGFDYQRGRSMQDINPEDKVVILKGLILFGGGEIKAQ